MTIRQIIKKLEKHRDAIGRERDALRDLADEVQGLLDTAENGWHNLQAAIDNLSEQA